MRVEQAEFGLYFRGECGWEQLSMQDDVRSPGTNKGLAEKGVAAGPLISMNVTLALDLAQHLQSSWLRKDAESKISPPLQSHDPSNTRSEQPRRNPERQTECQPLTSQYDTEDSRP